MRAAGGMLVIARTDARSIEGFDAALARAVLYAETGADLIFVEGPESVEEMAHISAQLGKDFPLVHNLVEGGVSPVTSAAELGELGYAVALHPLLLLHGFIRQGTGAFAGAAADRLDRRPAPRHRRPHRIQRAARMIGARN